MQYRRGIHLFAVAAALATFLLLSVGGVVTSRDAGMVFSDWPLSDGSVNPDGWVADPDQRAEHGHRLLGALTGLLTIGLAVALQRTDPRRPVRVLGWVAVVAVCLQGLLGGLRVTEISGALALVHGCTGQAFFALMVALAYFTSRDALAAPERGDGVHLLCGCAVAVVFTVYAQVVLGAQLRHNQGPVNTHIFGAVVVAGTILWLVTIAFVRHWGRHRLRNAALLLCGLLVLQIGLGLATRSALEGGHAYGFAEVALPTAHQAVGGLMLATCMVLALRAFRRLTPAVGPVAEAAA